MKKINRKLKCLLATVFLLATSSSLSEAANIIVYDNSNAEEEKYAVINSAQIIEINYSEKKEKLNIEYARERFDPRSINLRVKASKAKEIIKKNETFFTDIFFI